MRPTVLMAGQIYSRIKKITSHHTKDTIILSVWFLEQKSFLPVQGKSIKNYTEDHKGVQDTEEIAPVNIQPYTVTVCQLQQFFKIVSL